MSAAWTGKWKERRGDRDSHDSGCDCVDSDTSGCLLLCECTSEGDDGTLGRAVVDLGGVAHVCENGGGVDNVVATLHVLESVLAQGHHL